jgi:hypothetical protein
MVQNSMERITLMGCFELIYQILSSDKPFQSCTVPHQMDENSGPLEAESIREHQKPVYVHRLFNNNKILGLVLFTDYHNS